jgi:hypothetical protein
VSNNIRKDLLIIEIEDHIEISSFCCKNDELNEFLYEKARFNEENLISKELL